MTPTASAVWACLHLALCPPNVAAVVTPALARCQGQTACAELALLGRVTERPAPTATGGAKPWETWR